MLIIMETILIFIGDNCQHIPKALNFNKIKKCMNKVGIGAQCSVCKKSKNDIATVNEEAQVNAWNVGLI